MAPDDALPLLASGAVDPRETALLEATPPGLERPSDHSQDAVHVDAYAPESIRVTATTSATGLLVLSEVAYPDWEVFVDGQPAGAYVVDHLFRGVVLPPGTHVVEWRYRSRTTMLGIALTLSTIAGVCALSLAPLLSRRSCRRTARPGRGRQP
jgi:hypothetical protein